MTNRAQRRADRAMSLRTARGWTDGLRRVPRSEWPRNEPGLDEVWTSKDWVVLIYESTGSEAERITVRRTSGDDGITWDDLMAIKRAVGRGSYWAVEIYPPDDQVHNVANMRHLWVVERPDFAWGPA